MHITQRTEKYERWREGKLNNLRAKEYLDKLRPESVLIMGAGQVQPRKGVDLFISVAQEIVRMDNTTPIDFIWLGSGFDPVGDFNLSIWLQDQIERSGLKDRIKILDNTSTYEKLLDRADIFLMTSRLDPLPNVAIDAMYSATPMLCFDKACGLASMLKTVKILEENLVCPYLKPQKWQKRR